MPQRSISLPRLIGAALSGLLVVVGITHAAPGVSLRWDQCYSDGGVTNKTFACDTNAGSERLVMSIVPANAMAGVSGMEFRVIMTTPDASIPSWWQFKDAGTFRRTSLTIGAALPPGSTQCLDWTSGAASGGIGSINLNPNSPSGDSRVISMAVAVPLEFLATLNADQEYFATSLVMNHAKTVGVDACAGCDRPMCIVLDYVIIRTNTPGGIGDVRLSNPAFGTGSNFAHWQNGQESNVEYVCGGSNFGCFHKFSCVLSTTPTSRSTWGQVKSRYR